MAGDVLPSPPLSFGVIGGVFFFFSLKAGANVSMFAQSLLETHSLSKRHRVFGLSDIKQSIYLDNMRLFAQAAPCSPGRWYR